MTAAHVARLLVLLELAQAFQECRPQGRIERNVDRAIAVFQSSATHGLAGLFFEQQAIGGELQAFALIRTPGIEGA